MEAAAAGMVVMRAIVSVCRFRTSEEWRKFIISRSHPCQYSIGFISAFEN